MLQNNLKGLTPNASPFAQAFRIDLNRDLSRCIVGIRAGDGVQVDTRFGIATISLDSNQAQQSVGDGGRDLDEKAAATGTSVPGYMFGPSETGVVRGDNEWIKTDGTTWQNQVMVYHIAGTNVHDTEQTVGVTVASTSVEIRPIVLRLDINNHVVGTEAGITSTFDLSGAAVTYTADETALHLATTEFQHKALAYGGTANEFVLTPGAGISFSGPGNYSFSVGSTGHVTSIGKTVSISANAVYGSNLLSGDGTWTQLTGTVLYHIGPDASSSGNDVSGLSDVAVSGTVASVGGAAIVVTQKTVKFDAKGHRATSTNPAVGTVTNIRVPQGIDDLSDVTITSPAAGDLLRYDGSKWVNYALATTAVPISWTVECSGTTFTVTVTGTAAVYRPG